LLIATVKVKLATKKRFKIPTNIKYREPTSAQIEAYNESFRKIIEKQKLDGSWHTQDKGNIIARSHTNRQATSHKVPIIQKKNYLPDRTWQLILQKEKAIEDGSLYLLPQLNKA
jgi:hypothetical protein